MVPYTSCGMELEFLRHGAGVPAAHRPEDIWRHNRRGWRAGVKVRERIESDRTLKTYGELMGNVRSLANQADEQMISQRAYRECTVLCFTETWLNGNLLDSLLEPAGFTQVQADSGKQSGKKRGGSLALFVNSKACNPGHVTVCEGMYLHSRYSTDGGRIEILLSATGVFALFTSHHLLKRRVST